MLLERTAIGFVFDGAQIGEAFISLPEKDKHTAKLWFFDFIVEKSHLDAKSFAEQRDAITKKEEETAGAKLEGKGEVMSD